MKSDSSTNVKNNFSLYLDRVKRGEAVLILEHGKPVAELRKPSLLDSSELALAGLEREGLVSRPVSDSLDVAKFLSERVKLKSKASLSSALLAEKDESAW
jgi:PHD/YefM family antitoxin component YafN of YafNO toxin-antitoxin module